MCVCVCVGRRGAQSFHMHGGEERQGGAGSGLPVLSCERQTFGRVITRRTALGVISDSCLFKVFGAHSLYGLRLPSLCSMFRLHLHQEESCMCQHKQYAGRAFLSVHSNLFHWCKIYHIIIKEIVRTLVWLSLTVHPHSVHFRSLNQHGVSVICWLNCNITLKPQTFWVSTFSKAQTL